MEVGLTIIELIELIVLVLIIVLLWQIRCMLAPTPE